MSNRYATLHKLRSDDRLEGGVRAARARCAARLLEMRRSLDPIRARKSDSSLLLATWNIRDFDSNEFGWGHRLPEAYFYIAEIISTFDLVAIQEINRDLSAFNRVMDILGREWDYIITDTTEGTSGNGERMAFVYNTEKVWFRRIAGEIVLPDGQLIVPPDRVMTPASQEAAGETPIEAPASVGQQFARTPFLVAFQSGWFRFSLCTVHIYYGADSGAKLQRRIEEIRRLVDFFARRQDRETQQELDHLGTIENYILLGDFNVVSPKHKTMQALQSAGFIVPEQIGQDVLQREEGDHFYDQIAVRVKDPRFSIVGGGLVNMFQDVFRLSDDDRTLYNRAVPHRDPESSATAAASRDRLYRKWRTWQMSDHKPLWIEIKTDFADHYLGQFLSDQR